MKRQKTRPSLIGAPQFSLKFLLIALVAVVTPAAIVLVGDTFAAKPSPALAGTCSVSPNPATVGEDYVLTGSGLGANTLVNVLVADSHATASWNLQADANGNTSLTWHSYWTGTTNVTFQVSSRHKYTKVATCSFQVQ